MLVKTFYVEGTRPYRNMGTSVPPWNKNYKDISSWYNDANNNFYYNIVNNEDIYIQYGKNATGWAAARFLSQSLEIIEEKENSDGSITATIKVQAHFFRGRGNEVAQDGFFTRYDIRINNQVMYQFTGNSIDNFEHGQRPAITFEVNVNPQQTNTQSAFRLSFTYPNNPELDDNIFTVGFGLFNPNQQTYVPMAIRKSGSWKDLETNNGKIKKRVGSSWQDYSNEDTTTSKEINKGKNRIRRSGNWRQLPKMKGGTV